MFSSVFFNSPIYQLLHCSPIPLIMCFISQMYHVLTVSGLNFSKVQLFHLKKNIFFCLNKPIVYISVFLNNLWGSFTAKARPTETERSFLAVRLDHKLHQFNNKNLNLQPVFNIIVALLYIYFFYNCQFNWINNLQLTPYILMHDLLVIPTQSLYTPQESLGFVWNFIRLLQKCKKQQWVGTTFPKRLT